VEAAGWPLARKRKRKEGGGREKREKVRVVE